MSLPAVRPIESLHNDTFKALLKLLQQARERRKSGQMVLEGVHLCQAALDAGLVPHSLYLNDRSASHPELAALLVRCPKVPVYQLGDSLLGKLSELSSAPELLAIFAKPQAQSVREGDSAVLLENLQDPGNLGTILRSAAASGIRQVLLSKGCTEAFSPKALRAGMGAHFALAISPAR